MDQGNWDDLRFVLAVADTGSVSAAARRLGVTHGTVIRRIAAFEDRQGEPLFARHASGYTVLPERQAVIEAVRDAEFAALSVDRLMGGGGAEPRGAVRITSTDTLCQTVLPRAVAAVQARFPELRLSLICSNVALDYTRAGVDVTVRPAMRLPEGLVGTAAGELRFGVYTTPGAPDRWLALEGPLGQSAPAAWITRDVSAGDIGPGADSFQVLREMVAAGLGRSWLPSMLGDPDPRMARWGGEMPDFPIPLWVACQADMAGSARVRAVRSALAEALAEDLPPASA
ncbi:LysR family transcriptional regulator [Mesobacterium pallidum]|uniref:LysR family transcriptional regulator n=1 Tax=Mesobacterium pallidum TaxID=2872037 RepID=UPI001EE2AE10|nr:LysR family transcriptional regulator [Mesobacterium pallidum]